MKCKLLLSASLLTTTLFSATLITVAQDATKSYAVTGKANNTFLWADIKQVDLATGKVIKTLFESNKTAFKTINFDNTLVAQRSGEVANPTGFGVAACALDTRHNRLYFATMHFGDIQYLDLDKPEATFNVVKRNALATPANAGYQSEENHITRMVIAADGFGYALSNDGNHLIRFGTSGKATVQDLGNLVDADSNKGISIHNKCTSWGGDMVADAFGKLVIVSANHSIFFVDTKTRIATYAGNISGLPATFTTNGAAVDNEGNLVVSSANVFEGLYVVNVKELKAVKLQSNELPFNASDLANGNFLSQKQADDLVKFEYIKNPLLNSDAKIYPNPLTGTQFNVVFDNQPAGKYTIQLTDLAGRALQNKVVVISKAGQVENIQVIGKNGRGMYLVKVLNSKGKLAFSDKIVIE